MKINSGHIENDDDGMESEYMNETKEKTHGGQREQQKAQYTLHPNKWLVSENADRNWVREGERKRDAIHGWNSFSTTLCSKFIVFLLQSYLSYLYLNSGISSNNRMTRNSFRMRKNNYTQARMEICKMVVQKIATIMIMAEAENEDNINQRKSASWRIMTPLLYVCRSQEKGKRSGKVRLTEREGAERFRIAVSA